MPDHKLKSVEFWIKYLMPFTQHIIAGENKNIAFWRKDSFEICEPIFRTKFFFVPFGNVVI